MPENNYRAFNCDAVISRNQINTFFFFAATANPLVSCVVRMMTDTTDNNEAFTSTTRVSRVRSVMKRCVCILM